MARLRHHLPPLLPQKNLWRAATTNSATCSSCVMRHCVPFLRKHLRLQPVISLARSINGKSISKFDCKDHFHNICPTMAASHLQEAFNWQLAARRKWRRKEIEWSIHKDTKQLDQTGRPKAEKFYYPTHSTMCDTIAFKMHCNNFIHALGSPWSRHGCTPTGQSFLARAADLHTAHVGSRLPF